MRLDDGFGRAPTALADKVFTVLFPFCGVGGAPRPGERGVNTGLCRAVLGGSWSEE